MEGTIAGTSKRGAWTLFNACSLCYEGGISGNIKEKEIYNGYDDSGTSWIESDMLCNQWQIHMFGIKHCMTVFRNPEGTSEMKNGYLAVSDFGIQEFSPVD